MIKSFWQLLNKKFLIFLILALLASPILWGYNTFSYCLIESHYLTVYVNNLFLLFVYQFVYCLNQIYYPLLVRIDKNRFDFCSYFFVLGLGICYVCLIYVSYYIFFGAIPTHIYTLTWLFMVVNLCICCIECSLVYMQLGKKKRFLYLAIPIFLNFLFHMMWIYYF